MARASICGKHLIGFAVLRLQYPSHREGVHPGGRVALEGQTARTAAANVAHIDSAATGDGTHNVDGFGRGRKE